VYETAEALFGQLADECKKYQDWLVLGDAAGGNLDDYVESQISGEDVTEWELNLKMIKAAARDVDRLPQEVCALHARQADVHQSLCSGWIALCPDLLF
jgi:dynein heavy chain 2